MKYSFYKYGHEKNWGWWLEVTPDRADMIEDLHRKVAIGMYRRFNANPHLEKNLGPPLELAAKWLQSIEKFLSRGKTVFVNENGGMFAGDRQPPVSPLAVVHCDTMRFPPAMERIKSRKIDISKWYGGQHYYLQCQDKIIFSKEKYDTIEEARFEAELYALPHNIRLCACDFQYTREGD